VSCGLTVRVRTDRERRHAQPSGLSVRVHDGKSNACPARRLSPAFSSGSRCSTQEGWWLVILRVETLTGGLTKCLASRGGQGVNGGTSSGGPPFARLLKSGEALALNVPIGGAHNAAQPGLGHGLSRTDRLRGGDGLLEVRGEVEKIETGGVGRIRRRRRDRGNVASRW
jgi:hypothetical protein